MAMATKYDDGSERGTLVQRWAYRQEMRDAGVWSWWAGLPTRDEYAVFHDARNLRDMMNVWTPAEVERVPLGALMDKVSPFTWKVTDEIKGLTWKRVEEGLTQSEYRHLLHAYQELGIPVTLSIARRASWDLGTLTKARLMPAPRERQAHERVATLAKGIRQEREMSQPSRAQEQRGHGYGR